MAEAVDDVIAAGLHGIVVQRRGFVANGRVLVGKGSHANFDSVNLLDGEFRLVTGEHGAQIGESLLPHSADGALIARLLAVVAMVVDGEQHIKACVFRRIHNGIRAVEHGVALVGLGSSCQSGFQVGNRIVCGAGILRHIGEDVAKIIAAVLLLGIGNQLTVHQQVTSREDGSGGNNVFRFGRSGGGRDGGCLGSGHGCKGDGLRGNGSLGLLGCRHQPDAQIYHNCNGSNHNCNQNQQHIAHAILSFFLFGHIFLLKV